MKRKLLALILSGAVLTTSATAQHQTDITAFTWSPVEINGTPYIPFDQIKAFYHLEEAERDGKSISLTNKTTKIDFTAGSHVVTINEVKFFLSEAIILSEAIKHQDGTALISRLDLNTLLDPVLRPSFITGARKFNTVILDAGHGGNDKGSANLESDLTLSVVKKTSELLAQKGFNVVLTRSDDSNIPLKERVAIANKEKSAILISLHFNSGDKTVSGMETYIISARKPHPQGASSTALATAVHSRSLLHLNNKRHAKGGKEFEVEDRGIRHAKFRLLKDSNHPAILIEAGFLTNDEEAAKIQSKAYQDTLAKSIVRGIQVYRMSIDTKKGL